MQFFLADTITYCVRALIFVYNAKTYDMPHSMLYEDKLCLLFKDFKLKIRQINLTMKIG